MTSLKNILAASDLSEKSRVALRRAALLARGHGARLELLHVVEDIAQVQSPAPLPAQAHQVALHRLTEEARAAVPQGVAYHCRVEPGKAFVTIIRAAVRCRPI